jgi:hypothetical protein
MMSDYENKIKECYNHITKYWKNNEYETCKQEWEHVKNFIIPSNISIGHECNNCGTNWAHKKFINEIDKCCCSCDTHIQPFLSNPFNRKYVLRYIPENYHEYILYSLTLDNNKVLTKPPPIRDLFKGEKIDITMYKVKK